MLERIRFTVVGAAVLLSAACSKDKSSEAQLAPTSSALQAAPAGAQANALAIDTPSSKVTFTMEAPIEKITGEAPGSAKGDLFVDPSDVTKTTGLITIDLAKLTLYQQKRDDEKAEYSTKVKNDKQNEHARNWLEISDDSPNHDANRSVQFKLSKVENASATDVTKLTGDERKITATVSGEFLLHGHKNTKSMKVELDFKYAGDKLTSLGVKSLEPMNVNLAEYEVKPRDAVGSLLQKGLDALAPKVAKEAPIVLELTANPK